MLGALAQRQRDAIDDYIGPVMVPIVTRDPADPAADALGEPIILPRAEQVTVARQHLFADRRHLSRRQARVDIEVFERAVETGDMLLYSERLAVKAPRHVEDRVAAQKALIAERDHDLALADEFAVEPGDAFITERHRSASYSAACATGAV